MDNKSHPSASRIATQLIIRSNRANKQVKESTLPDETETSNSQTNKGTLPDATPNSIPDETHTIDRAEANAKLSDETKGKETQTTTVEPVDKDGEKPDKNKKGVFKTKMIIIRRTRDP